MSCIAQFSLHPQLTVYLTTRLYLTLPFIFSWEAFCKPIMEDIPQAPEARRLN